MRLKWFWLSIEKPGTALCHPLLCVKDRKEGELREGAHHPLERNSI